ncbi:MAG: hypothetical protein QXX77_07130 [Candidatus Methanosuratincola sp.]
MVKSSLWQLYNESKEMREHIDGNLVLLNGKAGDSESYRLLDGGRFLEERDGLYVNYAARCAKEKNPALTLEIDFLCRVLLSPKVGDDAGEHSCFVMRFQQLTAPAMAKGLEDTTLYVYNGLLSLNDVGGSPGKFGVSLDEFHRFNACRAENSPLTMNATSTHDSKRGEDVRARINVLSEIPLLWERNLLGWSRVNEPMKRVLNGKPAPDRNDEYFLYQTLIGAYSVSREELGDFADRIERYMIKAAREAKVNTSWHSPDGEYKKALPSFVDGILGTSSDGDFLREFLPFQRLVAHCGILNSLSQTILKITSPGVPDFYQGSELWDLNLVDPDNRRPVDYKRRKRLLAWIRKKEREDLHTLIRSLLEHGEDGRIKLFLIYRTLKCRGQWLLHSSRSGGFPWGECHILCKKSWECVGDHRSPEVLHAPCRRG